MKRKFTLFKKTPEEKRAEAMITLTIVIGCASVILYAVTN